MPNYFGKSLSPRTRMPRSEHFTTVSDVSFLASSFALRSGRALNAASVIHTACCAVCSSMFGAALGRGVLRLAALSHRMIKERERMLWCKAAKGVVSVAVLVVVAFHDRENAFNRIEPWRVRRCV